MSRLVLAGIKPTLVLVASVCFSAVSHAQLVFTFEEDGGDVTMTASGSIDTADLTSATFGPWAGTGINSQNGYGNLGDDTWGATDVSFAFSSGTNFSQWDSTAGCITTNYFSFASTISGTPFATYANNPNSEPGLSIRNSDLVGTLWTPVSSWRSGTPETFASLGLQPGTCTVTDAITGASITIVVAQAQTITFDSPGDQTVGVPVTLTATASSGLPVNFSSSNLSVCDLNAGVLMPLIEGTCTISADQVGDAQWEAAPTVEHTITVVSADSDGDGVNDDSDQCDDTPSAEEADDTGCSPSQRDSDSDGVYDDQDAFPYDPTETADSDGDGVGDNADAFPDDPTRSVMPVPVMSPLALLLLAGLLGLMGVRRFRV